MELLLGVVYILEARRTFLDDFDGGRHGTL